VSARSRVWRQSLVFIGALSEVDPIGWIGSAVTQREIRRILEPLSIRWAVCRF